MGRQTDENPLGYTPARAADRISLSTSKVRQLIYAGELPAIQVGKRWIIPAKALESWLDSKLEIINHLP